AKIHVADINRESAEAVAREIEARGGSAVAHVLDVADPAAVEAFAEVVFAADARVDILHNNAGIGHAGNIEATTFDDWRQVIEVNLLGVAYGMQAFAPRMLAQGSPASIINTASMLGLFPGAKLAPYCASKYGVVGLSESLNAELGPRGIRVSAICPGIIDTAIVATGTMRGEAADLHSQAVSYYAKRGASPEEVAEAVLRTIKRPQLVVPAPRRQVSVPYFLHRVSPRLLQPIARNLDRLLSRG
ncbi:MAG: SDR family NAD(P)-dependent oxidoreductase, partial [Syntrophothermus sp.]